jgi:hypothetical protein
VDAAVDALVRDWKNATEGISGCEGLRPARSRI